MDINRPTFGPLVPHQRSTGGEGHRFLLCEWLSLQVCFLGAQQLKIFRQRLVFHRASEWAVLGHTDQWPSFCWYPGGKTRTESLRLTFVESQRRAGPCTRPRGSSQSRNGQQTPNTRFHHTVHSASGLVLKVWGDPKNPLVWGGKRVVVKKLPGSLEPP